MALIWPDVNPFTPLVAADRHSQGGGHHSYWGRHFDRIFTQLQIRKEDKQRENRKNWKRENFLPTHFKSVLLWWVTHYNILSPHLFSSCLSSMKGMRLPAASREYPIAHQHLNLKFLFPNKVMIFPQCWVWNQSHHHFWLLPPRGLGFALASRVWLKGWSGSFFFLCGFL